MTSEIHLTPSGHAKDCEWHVDQYPWECTCGFIPRKKAMDDLIAQDADLIDDPLMNAVRELLTDDSMEHLGAFTHNLIQALDRHGLRVVSAHPSAAPTDALVEKVARALADSDGARWDAADYTHTPSGEDPEDMREGYRQNARAALAAMQGAKQ